MWELTSSLFYYQRTLFLLYLTIGKLPWVFCLERFKPLVFCGYVTGSTFKAAVFVHNHYTYLNSSLQMSLFIMKDAAEKAGI